MIDFNLPQRPEPDAPAGTVGLNWNAYSGVQMTLYGRQCYEAAMKARIESEALAQQAPIAPQAVGGQEEPVAWVYTYPDGEFEPSKIIPEISMEDVRRKSGAWTPLYAAPTANTPAVPDATAWLVEIQGPAYLGEQDDGIIGWTTDDKLAIRFPSRNCAEHYICVEGLSAAKAVEHMWCAAPSPVQERVEPVGVQRIALLEAFDKFLHPQDFKIIPVPTGQSLDFDEGAATRRWLWPHLGDEYHLCGFYEIPLATPPSIVGDK